MKNVSLEMEKANDAADHIVVPLCFLVWGNGLIRLIDSNADSPRSNNDHYLDRFLANIR